MVSKFKTYRTKGVYRVKRAHEMDVHAHGPFSSKEEADAARDRLNAEACSELLALAHQYRNDMLYPPAADSRARRIEAIDAALAKAGQQ